MDFKEMRWQGYAHKDGRIGIHNKGSILFQASMASYIGQPNVAGYSTAKAGYLGLMHTLATECGAHGVRINAIAPGWIDTPMFHKATDNDPPRLAKILGRIPMNTVGDAMDIGMAAVFLCSDAARYITGTCLPVDGGALRGRRPRKGAARRTVVVQRPALRLLRQFEAVANLYPINLSVGMFTDGRSFLSYPRHELYRRILCSYLGTLVERGEYFSGEKELKTVVENICYYNAKNILASN